MNYKEIEKFLTGCTLRKDVWSLYKTRKELSVSDAAEKLGKSRTNINNVVRYLVDEKILSAVELNGKVIKGLYKKHKSVTK